MGLAGDSASHSDDKKLQPWLLSPMRVGTPLKTQNEPPRRKQRGILAESVFLLVASGGEPTPKRLDGVYRTGTVLYKHPEMHIIILAYNYNNILSLSCVTPKSVIYSTQSNM